MGTLMPDHGSGIQGNLHGVHGNLINGLPEKRHGGRLHFCGAGREHICCSAILDHGQKNAGYGRQWFWHGKICRDMWWAK